MGRLNAVLMLGLVACALPALPVSAQSTAERQALASQIGQRFDVLLVQRGVVLTPKRANPDVRSIELTDGAIAIDGKPVTNSELKQRLAADADLILGLSYLPPPEQRALFESSQSPAITPPADPAVPAQAEPSPLPAPPGAPQTRGPRGRRGDRVQFGGNVEVARGEVVNGDVVSIGGSVKVDGEVRGDSVSIGGTLELGPDAVVDGDAVVVGGALRRDPGAQVGGEVTEVGVGEFDFGSGRWPFGGPGPFVFGSMFGSTFALVRTMTRLAVLCILASIVLLIGRGFVEQVGVRAAAEPVKAGAVGLLIQLLFVPVLVATIVVLLITIVGIPLLVLVPFAVLAFALLFLVGFTAVVSDIGRLAAARFGWERQNPYLIAALGIVLVLSPVLISRLVGFGGFFLSPITWTLLVLGLVAEYVVWTIGLGAVALVRLDRRVTV